MSGGYWQSRLYSSRAISKDVPSSDTKQQMTKIPTPIGFIGAGKMATALARGIVDGGICRGDEVLFNDIADESAERFSGAISGSVRESSSVDLIKKSQIVFIAVKPQFFEDVAAEIEPVVDEETLLISILPGISIAQLGLRLKTQRVVRVMPNTPCLVGAGVAGFCCAEGLDPADVQNVQSLLETTGLAISVAEKLMDAVTGLSGSGPAYVFTFVEALIDGAVLQGMPRDVARQMAIQTVMGSVKLLETTGQHPGVLRDQVTSPGGTTIAGVQALEDRAFRAAVMSAVEAAAYRAAELGDSS